MTLVKRIAGTARGAALMIGSGLSASATYIVTLAQGGTDVAATGSGTIDLTDLSFSFSSSGGTAGQINPGSSTILTGPASLEPVDVYAGLPGPMSFGSRVQTLASSGSGDMVGIGIVNSSSTGLTEVLAVPFGYVSNSPLSDTSTYAGQTFSSLGVTPGTYVWTWGSGLDADSFTLQIGPLTTVGEPSALSLLGASLAPMAFAGIWRKRSQT